MTDKRTPTSRAFNHPDDKFEKDLGSGKRTIFPGGDQLRGVVVVVVGSCWSYLKTPAEGLASILAQLFLVWPPAQSRLA